MPAAGRVSDCGKVDSDAHGCPACPHTCVGPVMVGSPTVFFNSLPAARDTDMGMHAACCGPNIFLDSEGSPDVFINGLAAHRKDDGQDHCGGKGKLIAGSPDVIING